jgi:succinate dehydrogenase/fumarate reductase-like Fe-S protein
VSHVTVKLVRGDEKNGRHLVTYDVPFVEGMSLLDAMFWLREHVDPALAVRYSCRSANACKECLVLIDKKPGFLCSTRAKANGEVLLEPLPARPWVCDLVTDLE